MEPPVTGQVAIVTGAGQGMGRDIALRLASDGMDVVIADLQRDLAEKVTNEVRALGRRTLALGVDVAKADDRQYLIDTTLAQLGRLDALVYKAEMQRVELSLHVTAAHWDAAPDFIAN